MTDQFDCPACNAKNERCIQCRDRIIKNAQRIAAEDPNPCTFRGICNLGRVLEVPVGNTGGKPCEGPRKTFLWSGRPGDHTYTVCRVHEGEFLYWYRAAKEVAP